ncbi:MAG: hypothetical protein AAB390_05230 [Patescibacteria group bacterium]
MDTIRREKIDHLESPEYQMTRSKESQENTVRKFHIFGARRIEYLDSLRGRYPFVDTSESEKGYLAGLREDWHG